MGHPASSQDCGELWGTVCRKEERQQVLAEQKEGPSTATVHTLLKKPRWLCKEQGQEGNIVPGSLSTLSDPMVFKDSSNEPYL